MSGRATTHGRRSDPQGPAPALEEIAADLIDFPRRLGSALLDEVAWLVVAVLPLWGLSLLAWHVSPWLLGALVVTVTGWTTWSLRRARTSTPSILGVAVGLALLQLAPVVFVMVF